ncbi:MAG: amidohydrolase family protein [Candidatus Lokiarchaeota archaeon]|nr:amidohydrolase family protein [Candidatus Lokiarchaeota archaeon]
MRVIDAHVHTWSREIISKKDLDARRISAKSSGIQPQLDSPVTNLVTAMKRAQIERAVILPIDSGLNQDMPLSLQEKTDWHADEVKDDDSLISFVGLDPRRGKEGLEELERAVRVKNCKGWKMYPPNGFYPDNEDFFPYYELAAELNIPIVIHQGFTSRFKHVKYARPVYVDKIAAEFPQLKIVLAHVGMPWVSEALMVSAKNPNVSVDISGWQIFASKTPHKLYEMIAEAKLWHVFPNRVIWGSDFPLFEYAMRLEKWVKYFANLKMPDSFLDRGYQQITSEEIEIVMWKNAARLFFGENI